MARWPSRLIGDGPTRLHAVSRLSSQGRHSRCSADAFRVGRYDECVVKRPGIKDVAEAAGVSPTTVSDALSGKGRLTESTREAVRAAAARLGYRPSRAARSLASGRTGVLLISVNSQSTDIAEMWSVEFFVEVIHSASTAALDSGYVLALAPATSEGSALKVDFDGAIVVDPVPGHYLIERALLENRPLVTTGTLEDVGTTVIDYDYESIVDTVLNHLWKNGARSPGLLSSPNEASYLLRCRTAYESWCGRRGVAPQISITERGLSEHVGYVAAEKLLAQASPVDAIFATLDRLALGAEAAAQSVGLDIPRDVKIVGLGDSELASRNSPSLSAVDLQPAELGRRAVERLIETIETGIPSPSCIVPAMLIARESSRSVSDIAPSGSLPLASVLRTDRLPAPSASSKTDEARQSC